MQLSSSLLKPWAGPRLRHFPQDKRGSALGLLSLLEEAPTASKEQLNYPQINFHPLLFIFCGISLHNSSTVPGLELQSPKLLLEATESN